jgi:EAL domain-containing protein (putative c-di-GMP-specific phosphodiesterase class I)
VTLGHALGMKVLGEGVETDEQRVLLRLAGCDELQGHLFAMPVPAAEIDRVWVQPARPARLPAVA